ncbi:MAG: hypothetical protein H7X88_04435 [Gloeobacteraceae cyanobacterium ES-bin-316]|nr:hypothetical protein [Ferruginibacter sp.]
MAWKPGKTLHLLEYDNATKREYHAAFYTAGIINMVCIFCQNNSCVQV